MQIPLDIYYPLEKVQAVLNKPKPVTSTIIRQAVSHIITQRPYADEPYTIFYIAGTEEIEMDDEYHLFKENIHVVVRFRNDAKLLLNMCRRVKKMFSQAINKAPDVMSLSKQSQLMNNINSVIHTPKKEEEQIVVFLSSPLVTQNIHKLMSNNRNRMAIKISQVEKQIVQYYKGGQIVENHNRFFKQLNEKGLNLRVRITHAERQRVLRNCENIKIRQLMCDAYSDPEGKVYLLLEDERNIGVQNKTPFLELIQELPSHSLLILIGLRAHIIHQILSKLLKETPAIITIDTNNFSSDKYAIYFIEQFYESISKCNQKYTLQCYAEAFVRAMYAVQNLHKELKQNKSVCYCQHEHQSNCQLIELSAQYGLNMCHSQFHRYCYKTVVSCLNNGCSIGKQANKQLHNSFQKGGKHSCFLSCCCKTSNSPDQNLKQWNELHSLQGKIKQHKLPIHDFNFQVKTEQLNHRIYNKIRTLWKYGFKINTLYVYQVVHCITNSLDQIKIVILIGENSQNMVRELLVRPAIEYVLQRMGDDSGYRSVFIDLQHKHRENIEQFICMRIDAMDKIEVGSFQARFRILNLIVVLYNCPNYNTFPDNKEKYECGRGIQRFAYKQGFKSRIRLFMVTDTVNQVEIKAAQIITIDEMTKAEFLNLLVLKPNHHPYFSGEELLYQGVVDLSSLCDQIRLNTPFRYTLANLDFYTIQKFAESMRDKQRSLKQIADDPPLLTSRLSLEISHSTEQWQIQLNELLYQIAIFPDGLTFIDLQLFLPQNKFNRLKQLIYQKIRQQQSTQQSYIQINSVKTGNYQIFTIQQSLKHNWLRIRTKRKFNLLNDNHYHIYSATNKIQLLKYLADYTTYMLFYSKNHKKHFESLHQGSAISSTGIFNYKRYTCHSNLFDKDAYLETSKQDVKERCQAFHHLLGEFDFEKLYQMQQSNISSVYKQSFLDNVEDDQKMFHYFYILTLNLSAIVKSQSEANWLPNKHMLEQLIVRVRGISTQKHPKARNLLLIQLRFTEIGMIRKWKKSIYYNILDLDQEVRQLTNVWQQDSNIKKVWQIDFLTIKLMTLTNINKEKAQRNLFCQYLFELYKYLYKEPKIKCEQNIQYIRSRLALLAAEGIMNIGMDFVDDLKSFISVEQLLQDLKIAIKIYHEESSSLLELRSHIPYIYLRIQTYQNINSEIGGQQQNRKYLQTIKRELDKLEDDFFSEYSINYGHQRTTQRFRDLRRHLYVKMKILCQHTFIFLISEGTYQPNMPVIYKYQSTLARLRYYVQGLPSLNISILVNHLTINQLKKCCDSAADVLYLFVDYDSNIVTVDHQDQLMPETLEVSQFCSHVAKTNCESIVLCGKNVRELAQKMCNRVLPIQPIILTFDTYNESDKELSLQARCIIDRLRQEYIIRFVIGYCELVVKYPNQIGNFLRVQAIQNYVISTFTQDQRNWLNINLQIHNIKSKTEKRFRTAPRSYKRFWSEWSVINNNLTFTHILQRPTIIDTQTLSIYKMLILNKQQKNMYMFYGQESKTVLRSVARLLIYHKVFTDGIFMFQLENFPDILELYIKKHAQSLYQAISQQSKVSMLVILNINILQPEQQNHLSKFINKAKERNIIIVITINIQFNISDFVRIKIQHISQDTCKQLVLDMTSTAYMCQKMFNDKNLLQNTELQIPCSAQSIFDRLSNFNRQHPEQNRFTNSTIKQVSYLDDNISRALIRRRVRISLD